MKYYYDLHIHSVLSSCADCLNTPNNILNMCMLKELDMISITDHNGSYQYYSIDLLKDSYNFFIIYGMEVTVKEGFHVLTYFKDKESLDALFDIINNSLDKSVIKQKDQILGDTIFQIVTDEFDEEKELIPYLLNQRSISFNDLINETRKLDGLVIPAHINRKNSGILDYIKDFSSYDIDGIEVYGKENLDNLYQEYPYLTKYKTLFNSDAHDIEMINERENYLELDSLDFESFKEYFKGVKNE